MKTSELLDLLRAGYTKDEIEKLDTEEVKTEEQKKEEVKTEEQKTEESNDVLSLANQVKELTKIISELQQSNAKSADSGEPKTQNADSVIRDFFGMKEGS